MYTVNYAYKNRRFYKSTKSMNSRQNNVKIFAY